MFVQGINLSTREWAELQIDRNGDGGMENAEWAQTYFHTSFSLVNMICLQTLMKFPIKII